MPRIFLLLIFLTFPTCISAQLLHSFQHLTSNDGLPATEVYQVKSDRDGYLWFCTDRGVSRFDGEKFRQFTLKDGLTDHTVFACHEDYSGKMWFVGFNGTLCYYHNDSIYPYAHNQVLTEKLKGSFGTRLWVDSSETIWLGTVMGLLAIDRSGQVVCQFTSNDIDHEHYCMELHCEHPVPFVLRATEYFSGGISVIDEKGQRKSVEGPDRSFLYIAGALEAIRATNNYYFTDGFDLYQLNSNDQITYIPIEGRNTRSLWEDRSGDIWLGVFNKGVLRFAGNDIAKSPELFLPGKSVSSIGQDFEGNFWFTTLDNGVFYLKNEGIRTFRQEPDDGTQKVIQLVADSHSVWVVFDDYRVYNVTEGKLNSFMQPEQMGIPRVGNGIAYLLAYSNPESTQARSYCIDTRTGEILSENKVNYYSPRAAVLSDNTLIDMHNFNGNGYLIDVFENLQVVDQIKVSGQSKNIRFSQRITDSLLLVGGFDGLYQIHLDKRSMEAIPLDIPEKFARINDADYYSGDLLAASHYYGVIVIHDGQQYRLNEAMGLPSNQVNDLLLVQDTLWISTTNGLVRLKLSDNYFESPHFEVFTRSNGLLSNDCYRSAYHQGDVWVASGHGLSVMRADWKKETNIPPRLELGKVQVNSVPAQPDELIQLGYRENDLLIELQAIGFQNRDRYKYYYRLNSSDSTWQVSTQGRINLASLAPGDYLFEAFVNNGYHSSKKFVQLPISISPPFWKNPWYLTSAFILLSLLVMTFFRYRLRVQEAANRLEHSRELAEAEKKMAEERLQIVNLENELLDSQVKWQQQRLVSRLMEGSARSELFNQLKKELHSLLVLDKRKRHSKTRELIHLINQFGGSDSTWKEFHDQFDKVHPGFYEKLAELNVELTTNDLRYCSLIRMNMNAKEIAGILNISPDTVRIARYRLKKKLGLSAEQRLTPFVMKI